MTERLKIITPAVWAPMLAVILIIGCGKKAPPVAPRRLPLTQVRDLQGDLRQGTVRLTWNHTPDNAGAKGYIVLRAQSSLSQPDCPECPMVFQKVETISMRRSMRKKQHAMEFYQDVAQGFQYTYSVRPYQSSGAQGPDSNLVVITCSIDRPHTPDRGMPP
jgi:hypothetical protein